MSDAATATVARAHADMKTFMNAGGDSEAVTGANTSQLLENLAGCRARLLAPGDEVRSTTSNWGVLLSESLGSMQLRWSWQWFLWPGTDSALQGASTSANSTALAAMRSALGSQYLFRVPTTLCAEVIVHAAAHEANAGPWYKFAQRARRGAEIRFPVVSSIHIVHEAAHDASAGPWYKLAQKTGATLKVWKVHRETLESRIEDLAALLSPATNIVAVVHVSNILGEVASARLHRCSRP